MMIAVAWLCHNYIIFSENNMFSYKMTEFLPPERRPDIHIYQ